MAFSPHTSMAEQMQALLDTFWSSFASGREAAIWVHQQVSAHVLSMVWTGLCPFPDHGHPPGYV